MGRSSGSPPRGRGKGLGLAVNVLGDGIIPAWAGKSYCPATRSFGSWDHPRVGGEKPRNRGSLARSTGSPPRGRGKVTLPRRPPAAAGITPAWAGKSGISHAYRPRPRDHPRVGGEKRQLQHGRHQRLGSPPRGRGKDNRRCDFIVLIRITPAWAGKSYSRCPVLSLSEDHPRVGGEKQQAHHHGQVNFGSPPRGRGKVALAIIPLGGNGITPAWAGKSGLHGP